MCYYKKMRKTLFEELFNYQPESQISATVKDCGDVYTASLELAGFSKEDVKVFVADDVLKVEAKKDTKTKKCNLRLKNLVSVASIKSKMENGLLTLTLPKKEVAESMNIEIE